MRPATTGQKLASVSTIRAVPRTRSVRAPEAEASQVLADWDYVDAFECRWSFEPGSADAMTVAQALLGASRSAKRVLALRDRAVAPFGLLPAHQGDVLLFPILELERDRVVCGLDDRHLDFRVIVTIADDIARCTTVVRRHGALGAVYFGIVGPFHRRLVVHLMRRGAQSRSRTAEGL